MQEAGRTNKAGAVRRSGRDAVVVRSWASWRIFDGTNLKPTSFDRPVAESQEAADPRPLRSLFPTQAIIGKRGSQGRDH